MQRQLVDCPFPGGTWGDVRKPCQDMVFLLIVQHLAIGCKWVFGLTAMWMHPHQVHLPTLEEAGQKLLLLADEGTNWPYAYVRMNNAMAHSLLSSEGHISTLPSGLPSQNACGHLHRLQVWQLLQCRGQVVCLDGLNGGLESLLFNFKELLLGSMADTTQDLPMMDVDLSNMVHKASPSTRAEDPLSLNFRAALEELQWAFPVAPPLSLTIHHLQDTNAFGSTWSSSPNWKQSILPGL